MSDAPARLGKYEILTKLAVGGMAEIYLARATGIEGFEKHVVIKRIRPQLAEDQKFVHMFLDEARIAAQLQHQNIAQVYDIGEEAGTYYFAMEYLHGTDARGLLKAAARNRESIPLAHALAIVAGAAAGLEYAHNKLGADGQPLDIVHRDVSPSNILVTYDGAVKVVDFGIARANQRSAETKTGSLKGKISYMSPEQCKGQHLDRRSDIFSLGICLYELTTMSRMFPTRSLSEYVIMDRLVKGAFPRPSARRADYPPGLERIVMRALAVDRETRYASAADLGVDIEHLAASLGMPLSTPALSRWVVGLIGRKPEPWHDLPVPDTSIPGDGDDADGPAEHTISTTGVEVSRGEPATIPTVGARPNPPSEVSIEIIRPRRRWVIPALVGVVAAAAIAAVLLMRSGSATHTATTEPTVTTAADDQAPIGAPPEGIDDADEPRDEPAPHKAAATRAKPRAKSRDKPAETSNKKSKRRSDGLIDRSW